MYCQACGERIAASSTFCSFCGAQQRSLARRGSELHPAVVALALVFCLPVGVILMWTATDWNPDLKWAISGLLFPPLWLRFVWKVWWLPYLLGVLISWFIVFGTDDHGLSTAGVVGLITIAVVLLLTLNSQLRLRRTSATSDPFRALRQSIEDKLETCHDLIADIEADTWLDLAPASGPLRQRYIRALEMRTTTQDLLRSAETRRELLEVDDRLAHAVRELRAIRSGLTAEEPGRTY